MVANRAPGQPGSGSSVASGLMVGLQQKAFTTTRVLASWRFHHPTTNQERGHPN
jgi:hypothetical protein